MNPMTPLLKSAILLACIVALAPLVTACQTAREVTQRGDLDVAMSKHHVNLRWGRVPHAARHVHPEMRDAFLEDWRKRLSEIEISDIDVLEVYDDPATATAEASVKVTFVEKSTQRLRETVHNESWEFIEGTWLLIKPMLPDDILGF